MSQNINLFNPAFRRKRQVVSLAVTAQCLGVMLVTLFGYHYYLKQQVHGLAEEVKASESLLQSQRARLDKMKGRAATKPDAQLDAEIARYENELKTAREAMSALKGGALGNQQGFAEYLRAFSRQSVNGLWLTGFTIGGGGELEIRGRVLSPDLVPTYIQKLNKEGVLAGRTFTRLEMGRPKPDAAAEKKGEKPAAAQRFLEFSLATTDAARPDKTP